MKKISLVLAAASVSVGFSSQAQFASGVISFTQGSGASASYNNPNSALGAPSSADSFGYAIDPFYAPWQTSQLVNIGEGGSLTLQFGNPIVNNPSNPFGLDFIIFGHAGFNITNGDYSGGGITDGSFYQGGAGVVTVSVSADGLTFYQLTSPFGTQVDALFPTDSAGNPTVPVNPLLTPSDFAGKDLTAMRALYGGSAGGAGFDLSWAGVSLASVSYVRLDVISGNAFIDAVSVVPEPATGSIAALGVAALLWRRNRKA